LVRAFALNGPWRAQARAVGGNRPDRRVATRKRVFHFSANVAPIVAVMVFSSDVVSLLPSQLVDDE